jgi:hypothetical protein
VQRSVPFLHIIFVGGSRERSQFRSEAGSSN